MDAEPKVGNKLNKLHRHRKYSLRGLNKGVHKGRKEGVGKKTSLLFY
jgi:hypothetical protein